MVISRIIEGKKNQKKEEQRQSDKWKTSDTNNMKSQSSQHTPDYVNNR